MAAIVRLKRRITDDPPETILVSCNKKKKCNVDVESDIPLEKKQENITSQQVLRFAGTVPDKNEEISKHIRNAIKKEKLEKEYKRHINSDISSQNRILKKTSSSKNRYNIVSQFRAKQLDKIDEIADEEAEANKTEAKTEEVESSAKTDKLFCLYDMELESMALNQACEEDIVTCNSVPMVKEKVPSPHEDADKAYVYDLYYINQPYFNYSWLEDISYVDVYRQDSIYLHDEYSDHEDVYDEDEDSNDENNWQNDYPDEDPHFYDPVENGDDEEDCLKGNKTDDSDDSDDMLATQLERCFLGKEDEDNDGDDEEEPYEFNQFPYHQHTTYENYMERVLKELSET